MKRRYLKITGSVIWATNELTREDLVRLKDRVYDAILDLNEWKQFNAEKNAWEDIPSD